MEHINLVESYCKASNISDTNWLRYPFYHIWSKFGWVYDVITWLICTFLQTWISVEQKEIFENSKEHFFVSCEIQVEGRNAYCSTESLKIICVGCKILQFMCAVLIGVITYVLLGNVWTPSVTSLVSKPTTRGDRQNTGWSREIHHDKAV